jgi:NADH:ubiquinone oxidoreductase subunit E
MAIVDPSDLRALDPIFDRYHDDGCMQLLPALHEVHKIYSYILEEVAGRIG